MKHITYVYNRISNPYWGVIRPNFNTRPADMEPQGYVDKIEALHGQVNVVGWTFDRDSINTSIKVHVYVGGPAGSGEVHVIRANAERTDVNNVHGTGNYHGFNVTIPTEKTGIQDVYIYAINVDRNGNDNGLNNPLIGQDRKSTRLNSSHR